MTSLHKRLLGTWKSDKKRTLASYQGYSEMTLARKRKLGRIFGHLEVKYSPKFISTNFDGFKSRERYEVVAEDEDSLIIRETEQNYLGELDPVTREIFQPVLKQFPNSQLSHLHFETIRGQDDYWFALSTGHGTLFAEWFKRIQ